MKGGFAEVPGCGYISGKGDNAVMLSEAAAGRKGEA